MDDNALIIKEKIIHLTFRPGRMADLNALRALYVRENSPELPAPSNKDLETALWKGRFIVGETDKGDLVACATLIPFSPDECLSFVGELTGAFVDKRFRKGNPVSLQTLMQGLRLLHHVVLEGEPQAPATNTLMTVIRHDNAPSLANTQRAGFVECGNLPAWMQFDEHSWIGNDPSKWRFFHATSDTLRIVTKRLVDHGLLTRKLEIETISSSVEVKLVGFRELRLGADDIKAIAEGRYLAKLSNLPPEMVFPLPGPESIEE